MKPARLPVVSPEFAVHASVDALGGLQRVGVDLRPEYDHTPDTAGRWLAHCLDDAHREKLSLRRLVKIFRHAHDLGEHEGFRLFAELCGYSVSPIAPADELAELLRKAESAKRDFTGLTDELIARMKHANLRIEP